MLQRTQLIYSELLILTPLKTAGVRLRKLLTLRRVRCSAGEAARGPDEKARTEKALTGHHTFAALVGSWSNISRRAL